MAPLRIAREHVTDRVPVAPPSQSSESVRAAMVGTSFECVDDGLDPAFGSGPLATVLQDIFTIAIYFAVAG
jgi:hypothetical protein